MGSHELNVVTEVGSTSEFIAADDLTIVQGGWQEGISSL